MLAIELVLRKVGIPFDYIVILAFFGACDRVVKTLDGLVVYGHQIHSPDSNLLSRA